MAQLKLVGQEAVRDAAAELLDAQYLIEDAEAFPHPELPDDPLAAFGISLGRVKLREDRLIAATRTDLGIYGG